MSGDEIKRFLGKDWIRVQDIIRSALSSDIDLLNKVNAEVLSRSGKQLRPMVCLLTAMMCSIAGRANESSCRYAAASELLHNASLMHDDVADGSELRRGAPSVSARIGANAAVLLGDYWLSKAVGSIIGSDGYDSVVPLFSKTLCDLSEGEMLQLQKAVKADTTEEDYYRIIYCKTVSLFEASCVSGALSTAASEKQLESVYAYARALGYAFQIKDDILDYEGGEKMGKPMGVDIREGKITLPLLGAFLNAPGKEKRLRRMIGQNPGNEDVCAEVMEFVRSNGGVGYASARLDEYVDNAVRALDSFGDSRQKEYLVQIAGFNSYRNQ